MSTLPTPRLEASFVAEALQPMLGSSPVSSALGILEKSVISEQIRNKSAAQACTGDDRGAAIGNAASQEKILAGALEPILLAALSAFPLLAPGRTFQTASGSCFF